MSLSQEIKALEYGKLKTAKIVLDVSRELEFTKAHIQHRDAHPYIREAECLKIQTRHIFMPIQRGDWFAGRLDRMAVGIDPERGDLIEAAWFCQFETLEKQLTKKELAPSERRDIQFLLDYWRQHSTYVKCRNAFPEHIKKGIPNDDYYGGTQIAYPMYGLGGPCLDFEKLVTLGINGLRQLVQERRGNTQDGDDELNFFLSLEMVLDIFTDTAHRYATQARADAVVEKDAAQKLKLIKIAESLEHIAEKPPHTLHQAMQLVWFFCLHSLAKNYGRMDVYLGDFLARDLKSGILTKDSALEMVVGLWRLIVARGDNFNNRIIIGGKGRKNEVNADAFALFALEAQKIVNDAIPQLSVRWHNGMNPDIWHKAFEVLATGSTMPIIYNDDVNIPGVQRAMNVSHTKAEQYAFYGCGEFLIDHHSIASPDAALNVLKALDVTLRNGIDSFTGNQEGLDTGSLDSYESFQELQLAFARQIDYQVNMLADCQSIIYRETGKQAAFPFISLLYDDCIERGTPVLAGGVAHLGGTLESFGNNSAADALLVIKKLVYDEKVISAKQMLDMLDNNFTGYEKEKHRIDSIVKYGNDDDEADAISLWVNEMVCNRTMKQKDRTPLDSFLVVLVNNGDSVLFGKTTGATADGRKRGEPVSNGNQPSAGNDINGVTALLNSMAKLDAGLHAGTTQNIKFSKSLFRDHPENIKTLIAGYFAQGGTQIMMTTTDRDELEQALLEPEKYRHLFVRVGGYSERFVDLPKDVQQEIINRTLY